MTNISDFLEKIVPPSEAYIIGFGEGLYYVVKDNIYVQGSQEFIDYERGWFDGQQQRFEK